jgi:hypothetical protein
MPQCSVKRRICIWHKTPILFWPHGWLPWLCNIKTADTTSIFAYHRPTVICTYLLSGFMLHDTFCNIKPIAVWLQIASHTWCKISEQSVSHIFMSWKVYLKLTETELHILWNCWFWVARTCTVVLYIMTFKPCNYNWIDGVPKICALRSLNCIASVSYHFHNLYFLPDHPCKGRAECILHFHVLKGIFEVNCTVVWFLMFFKLQSLATSLPGRRLLEFTLLIWTNSYICGYKHVLYLLSAYLLSAYLLIFVDISMFFFI